jgi:hypothetical protein
MHGMLNVFYGLLYPACEKAYVEDTGISVRQCQRMFNLALKGSPDAHAIERNWEQLRAFLRNRSYVQLLRGMEATTGMTKAKVAHLREAFICLAIMVDALYVKKPSEEEIANVQRKGSEMREHMRLLGGDATPWGHIWTIHVPQFLWKWGTMLPFVAHGLEGRHKAFKQDVRLSCGGQWNGLDVGFAQTLRLDRITWHL